MVIAMGENLSTSYMERTLHHLDADDAWYLLCLCPFHRNPSTLHAHPAHPSIRARLRASRPEQNKRIFCGQRVFTRLLLHTFTFMQTHPFIIISHHCIHPPPLPGVYHWEPVEACRKQMGGEESEVSQHSYTLPNRALLHPAKQCDTLLLQFFKKYTNIQIYIASDL